MPGQNILPPFPRQTTNHGPQHARAHKRARETTPKPRHHATQARTEPVQTARRLDDNATTRQPRTPTTRTRAQARNPFASTVPGFTGRPFERRPGWRPRAPGASTGYVASRMALPRHAQGQHSRGRAWPRHHAWPAQRREERAQGHAHHASSAMPLLLLPCVVVRAGWPRGDQAPAPGVQALEERPRPPLPRREPTRARKRNPFPSRPPFIQVACLVACQVGWWVPYACRKRLRGGSVGSG
jgi:hypothetical protein